MTTRPACRSARTRTSASHSARRETTASRPPSTAGGTEKARTTKTLKPRGRYTIVGVPEQPMSVAAFSVIAGNKSLGGSMIGGIAETQEMLDYCAEHNIVSDIELTTVDKLPEAYERVVKGDVKYRFVIDMASLID